MDLGIDLVPEEKRIVMIYLIEHPNFAYRPSMISRRLSRSGILITPHRISKILLEMHRLGRAERFERGEGKSKKVYYLFRKT